MANKITGPNAAGRVSFQFKRFWPPASASSGVRQNNRSIVANGKGQLDCGYCTHFRTPPQYCGFHQAKLPELPGWTNRVCGNFEPGPKVEPDFQMQAQFEEVAEGMEAGVLYSFPYPRHDRLKSLNEVLRFHEG